MKKISVIGKGGSGKSTLVVTLADALAEMGKKVVVVDMDQQGTATRFYGLEYKPGMVEMFRGEKHPIECIHQIGENAWVLPTNSQLADLEMAGEVKLGQHMRTITRLDADFLFFDCPPHDSQSLRQALDLSDLAVVPLVYETFMIQTLTEGYMMAADARLRNGSKMPKFAAVVNALAKHLSTTKALEEPVKAALRKWKVQVFDTTIRRTSAIPNAALRGRSVLKHSPSHDVSKEYRALARELVRFWKEEM